MFQTSLIARALAVSAAIALTPSVWAVYTGLTIEHHTSVVIGGSNFDVYRVYADFSDQADRLVAGFGTSQLGPMTIQSRNSDDTDFGNPFFNVPGHTTAPWQDEIDANPDLEWDTFVTIGTPKGNLPFDGDHTSLSPGFTPISGNNWVLDDGIWYVTPTYDHDNNPGTPDIPPEQSLACWTGDGDLQFRVMMMQLTVSAGDNVRGTLNLSWFPPVGEGETVLNQTVQTFNSFIPGPSALGLLGIMVLVPRVRRRTEGRRATWRNAGM